MANAELRSINYILRTLSNRHMTSSLDFKARDADFSCVASELTILDSAPNYPDPEIDPECRISQQHAIDIDQLGTTNTR